MPRIRHTLSAAAALILFASSGLAAETPQLKRVLLSSAGIGYFEYQVAVSGWETVDLVVRADQVDDILKSAVVFDEAGGSGVIELPGKDGLAEVFKAAPVKLAAFDSLPTLFAALKGAEASVSEPVAAQGRIVSVTSEFATEPGDYGDPQQKTPNAVRHRVALLTPDGAVTFLLEESKGFKLTDPALDLRVQNALAAIDTNRKSQTRTLRITARGDGDRVLTIGYVAPSPVWKTTYRLVSKPDGTAQLQGWAIIENASGAPWSEVQLTLMSGNPVTFKQALYDTYLANRTTIPVEFMEGLNPVADEGSDRESACLDVPEEERNDCYESEGGGMGSPVESAPPPPPAPAPPQSVGESGDISVTGSRKPDMMIPPDSGTRRDPGKAKTSDTATQVTFSFPNAVTAGAGQTLVVPLVDRVVPADRVVYFQSGSTAGPLAALRVTNETGVMLPPGAVTLYDADGAGRNFVGDALLKKFPASERRMLSFAADQRARVTETTESKTELEKVVIAAKKLSIVWRQRVMQSFAAAAPANEARTLVIDVPKREGWDLTEPGEGAYETTPRGIRLSSSLAAGEERTLNVVWTNSETRESQLGDVSYENFRALAEDSRLNEVQRAAFSQLAVLMAAINAQEQLIGVIEAEIEFLGEEQERIRENLKAMDAADGQRRVFSQKLVDAEGKIDALRARRAETQAARDTAEKAFDDYAGTLNL